MSSPSSKKNDNYAFFVDIEKYIEKAKSAESTAASSNVDSKCKSFMKSSRLHIKDEETAQIICEQFIKLYDSLIDPNIKSKCDPTYKNCSEFLNYWVNFKLTESMKNEDYAVHYVYNGLESQITGVDGYGEIIDFICDIDKDELNKMNKLYNLYENYSKLSAIINKESESDKKELLSLSTQCCTYYNEASYICDPDNNNSRTKFCEELETFKSKYEDLYQKVDEKPSEISDNFIKLLECPNTKIISTAVTGSIIGLIPLFGVLYKVTELNIKLFILN
ncbi:hypothetical protein PVIIG_06298 [Plasmodium vivax India VII]|uniref:Variable surface protein Vir7-like protein n=1 Tax=Plasmodium vivax India VII TaxID=1077284 RepID=A0A0J9S277_PLAVI|nr:hypothetical protein PVIIG_06298 [Plasmodium vivax India VII]